MIRRFICLLLCSLLFVSCACAEGFTYSTASVTDCAQTASTYDKFYQSGTLFVSIPGVAEGLVPQGVTYLPEENWLLFAGYRSDKGNSALVAVDMESNQVVKEVFLQNLDGSAYNGHAGGVCATEKNIFVSNNHHLYRISLNTFRALPASGFCAFEEEIPVPVNSSYCAYANGVLWVGEFEYGVDYATDKSHKLKFNGETNKAWTCGYLLDENTENELKPDVLGKGDATPDYILSMTERIQGITVKDGMIYLSQSYGRKNMSMIFRYADVLLKDNDTTVEINGATVPVWVLNTANMDAALIAPPMTECLCTIPDGVIVLFESAAETYMNPSNASKNPMDRVFCLTDF